MSWISQYVVAAAVFCILDLLWLGTITEDLYARHLGHLFVSPLRPAELVIANFLVSLVRVLIGVGGASLLAIPLFHFSLIGSLGWTLLPFFAVLMLFGWAIGLIIAGLVIRLGLGAETLAWAAIFFIQPFSAVYYPVDTLPPSVRWLSYLLPSAPVFEGMRAVLFEHTLRTDLLLHAALLNVLWMALAIVVFVVLFRSARARGLLLQVGE